METKHGSKLIWKTSQESSARICSAEVGALRLRVIGLSWRVELPGSRPTVLAQGRSEGPTPDPRHDARMAALALAEEIRRVCT